MTNEPVNNILLAVQKAFKAQDNPGYSDLDNEQPISLNVRLTLGDIRRTRHLVQTLFAVVELKDLD